MRTPPRSGEQVRAKRGGRSVTQASFTPGTCEIMVQHVGGKWALSYRLLWIRRMEKGPARLGWRDRTYRTAAPRVRRDLQPRVEREFLQNVVAVPLHRTTHTRPS